MASFQELYIQSNIPLIIITISLICISIIGFLEFKKQSNKMNQLSNEIDQLKISRVVPERKIDNSKQVKKSEKPKEKNKVNMEKDILPEKDILETDILPEELSQMMGIQMGGMGGMVPPSGDMIFEMPPVMGSGGIANMIIGGPIMSMGGANVEHMFETQNNDLENENDFEEIDNEDNEGIEDIIEEDIENDISNKLENEDNEFSESENESDFSESSEECSSDDSVISEEDTNIELVQGAGKVEEIKEIDRSLSIKELKEICQKLGLSSSGNKETLIKRINNKK
jgi:hypothetical protein